jgi:hypothetical protein
LANIADTGGTNRIKTATSSPHVEIDDNLRVEKIGIQSAPLATDQGLINITPTSTISGAWQALRLSPVLTFSADGKNVLVLQGLATVKGGNGYTAQVAKGLQFEIAPYAPNAVTCTFTDAIGIDAICQPIAVQTGVLTVTNAAAVQAILKITEAAGGQATITAGYGVSVLAPSIGTGTVTTYYGIKVGDCTSGGTTNYGIYIEDASNYALFVDAGLSRFDGDGTDVFELPADATANGAAQVGRIPVSIGGGTQYLYYYGS